jgi:hypothetical protein
MEKLIQRRKELEKIIKAYKRLEGSNKKIEDFLKKYNRHIMSGMIAKDFTYRVDLVDPSSMKQSSISICLSLPHETNAEGTELVEQLKEDQVLYNSFTEFHNLLSGMLEAYRKEVDEVTKRYI